MACWENCGETILLYSFFPLSKCSGTVIKICKSKNRGSNLDSDGLCRSDQVSWLLWDSVSSSKSRGGACFPWWSLSTQPECQHPPGQELLEEEEEERAWAQEDMVPSKSHPSYFFVDQKNFYAKSISNEFKTQSRNESEMPNVCFFSTF